MEDRNSPREWPAMSLYDVVVMYGALAFPLAGLGMFIPFGSIIIRGKRDDGSEVMDAGEFVDLLHRKGKETHLPHQSRRGNRTGWSVSDKRPKLNLSSICQLR